MPLNNARILLVYRPLAEDQNNPEHLADRVEKWRFALTEMDGRVTTMPDTALKRSTIAAFLTRP